MKIDKQIFKEYDIRGRYPEEIDQQSGYQIGRAFARYKKLKRVVVARDFRPESEHLSHFFIKGLREAGCKVYDLGVDSTPALFFAVKSGRFDGGAIITASHNPAGYTGIKMCGSDGVVLGKSTGLARVAALAEKKYYKNKHLGQIKKIGILKNYFNHITKFVDKNKIKGFRLVVDSSGGSGSRILDYVFNRISSKVVKMNFKPFDKYPDHGLNPMLPQNYASIRKEVVKTKSHLGILADGDADRSVFIDGQGRFIHPFYLNCLLAKIILDKKPGITILIDARLPWGLSEVIKKAGGKVLVHRAGYANIVKTMKSKQLFYGCENSGHYMFNLKYIDGDNYVYGDAIIPVLMILEYLSENNLSLAQAIKPFRNRYLISGEINIKGVDFDKVSQKLKVKYKKNKQNQIDGLSVYGDQWFFNLRSSHTEPLVRLNIEARSSRGLLKIKKDLMALMS